MNNAIAQTKNELVLGLSLTRLILRTVGGLSERIILSVKPFPEFSSPHTRSLTLPGLLLTLLCPNIIVQIDLKMREKQQVPYY